MFNVLAWSIGMPELIVILIIALLIFGRRLPEVARSLGKTVTEFKKGVAESQNEIQKTLDDAAKTPTPNQTQNQNHSNN